MCASFTGVCMCCCVSMSCVNVREFPQQEDETFDSSRKESSWLLLLMWSVCFSLFSFPSFLFLFSLFLIYRSSSFPSSSSDLFLCSCLSALCANRRICVYLCVCPRVLTLRLLYASLRKHQPSVSHCSLRDCHLNMCVSCLHNGSP